MAIDYQKVMALKQSGMAFNYTERETMLYALGIGLGADPMRLDELPFVYENGLKAMPTLATVVAWGSGNIGASGINYAMVVHGEQRLKMHKPMPTSANITSDSHFVEVLDKGEGKGAVLIEETNLRDAKNGELICTLTSSIFARADGGFGGPTTGGAVPHILPERPFDAETDIVTAPNQALIYRLSGDRNPLHSDPNFAKMVGFPRPILHGLCTYGICARAIIEKFCGFDSSKLIEIDVRFSSPVFPGETISVQMWQDGDIISFEAKVKERDITVIKNGRALISN